MKYGNEDLAGDSRYLCIRHIFIEWTAHSCTERQMTKLKDRDTLKRQMLSSSRSTLWGGAV